LQNHEKNRFSPKNPPKLVKKRRNKTEQKHAYFKKTSKLNIPSNIQKNKTTNYQIANITAGA